MKKYAVIVAGGAGLRMGTDTPKQFLLLEGKPLLCHTIESFLAAFRDLKIILVIPALHEKTGASIAAMVSDPSRVQVIAGGDTRYHSVKNGLKFVEQDSIVFVHDGVRCLVTLALIQNCYAVAMEKGNAVPAIKCVDSVRIENTDGTNVIMDRNAIRIIQTPQTFRADVLLNAFKQDDNISFTDEASVVEKTGLQINLIDGEATNIKITNQFDLLIAAEILKARFTR